MANASNIRQASVEKRAENNLGWVVRLVRCERFHDLVHATAIRCILRFEIGRVEMNVGQIGEICKQNYSTRARDNRWPWAALPRRSRRANVDFLALVVWHFLYRKRRRVREIDVRHIRRHKPAQRKTRVAARRISTNMLAITEERGLAENIERRVAATDVLWPRRSEKTSGLLSPAAAERHHVNPVAVAVVLAHDEGVRTHKGDALEPDAAANTKRTIPGLLLDGALDRQ
jgi:hypothetical protein